MKCKICKKALKSDQAASWHFRNIHNISLVQYLVDYENFEIPKCPVCKASAKLYKGRKFYKTCGSKSCGKVLKTQYKTSEEIKQKISEKQKKAHAEGRHPGWAHINADPNRQSYPERFLSKVLKNYKIYDTYQIIEHMPYKGYFLDFAIIDLKLDLEIDGCQHLSLEAIEHDNKRNKILENDGWKVYRINWKEFQKNSKSQIKELVEYITNIKNKNSRYYL